MQVSVVEEDSRTKAQLEELGMQPDNLAASALSSLGVNPNDYEHFNLLEIELQDDLPNFVRVSAWAPGRGAGLVMLHGPRSLLLWRREGLGACGAPQRQRALEVELRCGLASFAWAGGVRAQ